MKASNNRIKLYLKDANLSFSIFDDNGKTRKHVFCNNYDLFVETLLNNNLDCVDSSDILNEVLNKPVITNLPKNSYCRLMHDKVYFVNYKDNYIVFYIVDKILNLKDDLTENEFSDLTNFLDEIKLDFSVSSYGYKKLIKHLRYANNGYDMPDRLVYLLEVYAYKGGYFINRFENTLIEGKYYDYDINSAYLDELKNLSFARGIHECKHISEVPKHARWIAYMTIAFGECKTNFPIRFNRTDIIKDFSENRFTGLITDVEFNDLLDTYTNVKYTVNACYYINPSPIKTNMQNLIDEIDELKHSDISWKKAFGKNVYTQMIGALSNSFKGIDRGNIYHQFILADVRSKVRSMAIKIENAGYLVYYIDTDGFSTNCPPEVMTELGFKISNNIGDLKIEREGYNFMATAKCKQYLWQDEDEEIDYKIAGSPEREVSKNLAIYKKALAKLNIRKEVRKHKEKFDKFLSKCSMYIRNLFIWWSRHAYQDFSYNDSAGLYYWDSISNL